MGRGCRRLELARGGGGGVEEVQLGGGCRCRRNTARGGGGV